MTKTTFCFLYSDQDLFSDFKVLLKPSAKNLPTEEMWFFPWVEHQLSAYGWNLMMGSGQKNFTWVGVWVWKISANNPKFFNFLPFASKKSQRVRLKNIRVKDGPAHYLLQVKSMLGSDQGPSLLKSKFSTTEGMPQSSWRLNDGNTTFRHMPFCHMPICHSRFAIVNLPYEPVCHMPICHTACACRLVSPAGLG